MGIIADLMTHWWLAQVTHADWQARARACRRLGELRATAALEALIARLDDEDAAVRRAACLALAEIGGRYAREALLERLADIDPTVRRASAEALRLMNAGEIVELLDSGSPLEGVTLTGEERASIIPLLRRWATASSHRLRALACVGLGRMGDEEDVPTLIAWASDDTAPVREAAISALGRLREPRALPALIALLRDADAVTRRQACQALGEIGDARALQPLCDILRDAMPDVRAEACRALARLGNPLVAPLLLALLDDLAPAVRWAACEVLGEFGDVRAVELLIARLKDGALEVRCAACRALGRLGDPRAVEPLLELVETMTGDTLTAACAALETLGEGELVAGVRRLLGNAAPGEVAQEMATEARLLRIARRWLESEYPSLRARACAVLAALGATASVLALLEDEAAEVRKAACTAFTTLRAPAAVDALLARLDGDRADIRELACRGLGTQGDAHALPALLRCMGEADLQVRLAACDAIRVLGEPMLGRALRDVMLEKRAARQSLAHLAERGDLRMLGPLTELAYSSGSQAGDTDWVYPTVTLLTRALKPYARTLCCTACMARVEQRTITQGTAVRAEVLTCRVCRRADALTLGINEIVAVLDDDMADAVLVTRGMARVNVRHYDALFDFDRVEVGQASDYTIEQFCMRAGNDTDPVRAPRYRALPVTVRAGTGISENALRVLDHVFGTVVYVSSQGFVVGDEG
ncbi:MAG: hypothetical protein BWY76_01163 [bacterium ADurb.Bin429]|nr:MAG: hypothetical protein BWY76_01163 [bacterium ADurb.Bin429]